MHEKLSLTQFLSLYPSDEACLEEIKQLKFPYGIYCSQCKTIKHYYKIRGRNAYACKGCRDQLSPLTDTIFEKSSTPLRKWFIALFLMTQTRGTISGKQLQRELEVTYKTAWRMRALIQELMQQNDGDLLKDPEAERYKEKKWLFFNKLEIKVVHKQEPKNDEEDFSMD